MGWKISLWSGNGFRAILRSPWYNSLIFPNVPNMFILLFKSIISLLLLFFKSFHSSFSDSFNEFLNLQSFPLGWNKSSLWLISLEWMNQLFMLVLKVIVLVVHIKILVGNLPFSDSFNHFKISSR
jgi:flagellar biosynthesis protein FlhB